MFDTSLFVNAIGLIAKERKIAKSLVKEAIEESLIKTYLKKVDPEAELSVEFNTKLGTLKLFCKKKVTNMDDIEDELSEISLEDAKKINPNAKVGDDINVEIIFTNEFGTLATLQVKQIIKQKIRETQKEIVFKSYKDRINTLIKGEVTSNKDLFYIVAFENDYGYLSKKEVPNRISYNVGDKVQAVITNIEESPKGIPIILSQNSPELIKRIMEEEIPEILNKEIEIVKIARFPGARTKMIVKSNVPGLDPVGTIIGESGNRIRNIISRVGREFIDVIPEIPELDKQIERCMVPAKVKFVHINDSEIIVVVDEENFSAAIGRGGSNAKVVDRLLGINISIKKPQDVDFEIPQKKPSRNQYEYNQFDNTSKYDEISQYDQFDDEDELYNNLTDDYDESSKKKEKIKHTIKKEVVKDKKKILTKKTINYNNDFNYDNEEDFDEYDEYDEYDE